MSYWPRYVWMGVLSGGFVRPYTWRSYSLLRGCMHCIYVVLVHANFASCLLNVECNWGDVVILNVLGMTLNCNHIFIATGSFLYWCVMRPASQRFLMHSYIYLRILIISYLATFLGTNSLSVLICRKAINQSINPQCCKRVVYFANANLIDFRN